MLFSMCSPASVRICRVGAAAKNYTHDKAEETHKLSFASTYVHIFISD